jgi:hypothetical protein
MKARRRPALHKHQQTPPKAAVAMSAAPSPRVINAAPSLEKAEMYGIDDNRTVFSRAMALAGRMFIETIPQWLAVGAMLSLIFGGCCSNVFALESIIKVEPASGMCLGSPYVKCAAAKGARAADARAHTPDPTVRQPSSAGVVRTMTGQCC